MRYELEKDDILVCFTDGILEATNSEGEEYGRQRLIALAQDNRRLGAHDLYHIIMEDVENFSRACKAWLTIRPSS